MTKAGSCSTYFPYYVKHEYLPSILYNYYATSRIWNNIPPFYREAFENHAATEVFSWNYLNYHESCVKQVIPMTDRLFNSSLLHICKTSKKDTHVGFCAKDSLLYWHLGHIRADSTLDTTWQKLNILQIIFEFLWVNRYPRTGRLSVHLNNAFSH